MTIWDSRSAEAFQSDELRKWMPQFRTLKVNWKIFDYTDAKRAEVLSRL